MGIKITDFDKLSRILEDAQRAAEALDGELGEIRFDPNDLSSVESAIAEARQIVDERLAPWSGNPLVEQLSEGIKAEFEAHIHNKVEEHNLTKDRDLPAPSGSIAAALQEIRTAISDLRRADYQTFDRHAARLARHLDNPALKSIVEDLTAGQDLDAWLKAGSETQSSMIGSAKLDWPQSDKAQLGLVILLARQFAGDSRAALNFAHTFYYNGSKITPNLQHMVAQVFVPFERDFSAYVIRQTDTSLSPTPLSATPKYPRRVFIVHGHDAGPREAVARLMERLRFEVIILHEQANRGRTIIEKFEEHADVGFAIVLLTPDDVGSAKSGTPHSRARQNVVLELGYFLGKLGRERVVAFRKGDVEMPSDVLGVVYIPFDDHGGWQQALAKELMAADYEIDPGALFGN